MGTYSQPVPENTVFHGNVARFFSRRPILTQEQLTCGYELLSRMGPESVLASLESEEIPASSTTRLPGPTHVQSGAAELACGLPAYLPCTREMLLGGEILHLPSERIVLEIDEELAVDREAVAACQQLHRSGYHLVLNEYLPRRETYQILPYIDTVKVDFLATDVTRQAAIASDMRRRGIRLLAQRVESYRQFALATRLGYQYFQGYFYLRPETLAIQDIAVNQMAYVEAMNVAHRDPYDMMALEQTILTEPTLCFRLLRYLNSAAFGVFPVYSIRHALSLLGQREIQRWIAVTVSISLSERRAEELVNNALTRARMCELLSRDCAIEPGEAFMTGILSLMDAMLNRPLEVVLSHLPIRSFCKDALRNDANPLGKLLRLSVACERGNWEEAEQYSSTLSLSEDAVWQGFSDACGWSQNILREHHSHKALEP
ncbi:MAG: HDOD domain-containing protein [Acidobacteriota bacterium]|nr:HDOD domain-containing protein [Acidobacteriota bacterium]